MRTVDRVAVVTGGSRGIGRAISDRLAAAGMDVVIGSRDQETAARAVARIKDAGGQATAVRTDITRPEAVKELFDAAESRYGHVDVWVNNAAPATAGPLARTTDDDFDQYLHANVRATFVALREAARRISDHGRIILISSALTVSPLPGMALLVAGKAAGDQLARTLAWEVGSRSVTVNSVLPGLTRTDVIATVPQHVIDDAEARTPLGRLGEPDDIAEVVAFLASDAARWITGQTINAAGGMI
ncbi:SDR family oxidoreductase [Spirillospora sp. NPDC000708]|jgi:3-oxoacyl-[acyl-carrier protein] reductase|uniref:SDR family NAD(P)-dependent oxidoreductase n=1 Tax=Actinomadura sp. RB99 TaxID=2691577 RepID=UPI001687E964|nr:SDR family oxidoreductase [Actinomadura sp. RB99]MBD2897617.1 3-oxoacyl-[acyl-carrier-protein] reductase FabG [Actinomadura sp. RB99]